jgi:hypothetical protein
MVHNKDPNPFTVAHATVIKKKFPLERLTCTPVHVTVLRTNMRDWHHTRGARRGAPLALGKLENVGFADDPLPERNRRSELIFTAVSHASEDEQL